MMCSGKNWRMKALLSFGHKFFQANSVWFQNILLWKPKTDFVYKHCIQSSSFSKFIPLTFHLRSLHLEHHQFSSSRPSSDIHTTSISTKHMNQDIEKGSREYFEKIGSLLDCTVEEVENLSQKYKFLHNINLDLMQQKVQIVLSYGLSPSVIYRNMRIVKFVSANELQRRLRLLQKYSLLEGPFVGYRLYCHARVFVAAFESWHQNQKSLEGCANQMEYIQYRLKCSESDAKKILSSSAFAKGYSSRKLKKQLDFLLNEAQISPQFLMRNPRLLAYSIERLRHRINVMNKAGITDLSTRRRLFYCSTKTFNKASEKMFKACKGKKQ